MSSRIFINFNDKNDMNNKLLVELLKQYQELITSSVGPFKSKLKFISKQDCSDSLILTNTSKNLFSCLYKINHLSQKDETKHEQDSNLRQFGLVKWQFELISAVVTNAHFSHFYDNGLFLCSLVNEFLINTKGALNESLNFDKPLSYLLFNKLIEHLVDLRSKQSSLVSIKLNLDNLSNFKNLLLTCLNTKCLVEQLDDEKKEAFINLCLKAFVKSFNSDFESTVSRKNKYFSEIIYLYDDAYSSHLNDSKVFDGILFKIDGSQTENEIESIFSSSKTNSLKCVLFDCSFSGDFEHLNNLDYTFDIELNEFQRNRLIFSQLDKFIDLFNFLIEKFKINVVLCQKVVHPSLKFYLKKRNIIALDRLSLVLTQPLADLTNCKICNSAWNVNDFNESLFGYLTSVSIKKFNNKSYVHFENNRKSSVQTMILCVQNESFTSEIEYLIKVAQNSFERSILNGVALCGGPCFYTYCLCYLWKCIKELPSELIYDLFEINPDNSSKSYSMKFLKLSLIKNIKLIFMSYIKNLLEHDLDEYKLDLECGHLFHSSQDSVCLCGLFSINNINGINLNISDLNYDLIYNMDILSFSGNKAVKRNDKNLRLIDCYESKLNAFKLARDILSTILHIGVFIYS